jgi:hypothetical protein
MHTITLTDYKLHLASYWQAGMFRMQLHATCQTSDISLHHLFHACRALLEIQAVDWAALPAVATWTTCCGVAQTWHWMAAVAALSQM